MHEMVSLNRKITNAANAAICAAASAAVYGRGVFTTVAVCGGKPFLWRKHWRRLKENAEKLEIDLSELPEETVESALFELLDANKARTARARLTFFDETASGIWSFAAERKTGLLIMTADRRDVPSRFRLTVSPHRTNSRSPLAGVKSCNYLEKILALDGARRLGFDEAVMMNERGEIASACMANVFWLVRDELFTAPLAAGCLAGTTREFLTENRKCAEAAAGLDVLKKADAIFLTSAGLGIVQVAEFEKRVFDRKFPEITETIDLK